MRNFLFAILLLFPLFANASAGKAMMTPSLGTGPSPEVVTEQVVAVLNGQLLFLTDILRDQIFFSDAASQPKRRDVERGDVEKFIQFRLLLLEAKRFVLLPPQEEEVDSAFKTVRKRFPNDGAFLNALQETGLSLEALRREILDRLWVNGLLKDRITFFIFITDEEIAQYYQQHQNDWGQGDIKESEEKIRAILEKEKEGMKLKEFLLRLASQANIEIYFR